ncbi:MAG: VanZ family protein, partial [Endomicrobia bacterium]|nr:VanZ family protein [Endomicrobiia bacterium]
MKKIIYWLEVILWCGVIFFFSSIPDLKIKQLGFWDFVLRKIAHITEYFVLVILFLRAFKISLDNKDNKKIYFLSIIFSILYAISDEIHQYFVPGRHFALTDILIDSIG